MNHGEMGIRATIVATFINELFIDGTDSAAISVLRDGFKADASSSLARNMVNNIIHYFECSDDPIEEFLYFIGIEKSETKSNEQSINTLLYMDEKQTPFLTDIPLSGDGVTLLNAALALHFVGMKNNANNLARIGIKLLMEGVFSDEISIREFNEVARKAISDAQREKAKKPRSPYYSEVIEVIKLTWEKYPCGAKTALLDALAAHYHGKVSRNALDNWISLSGLRPPKPEKYTRLELVFPQ
ncbi:MULTISPECIES: hypothetical protein [Klebsiella]|uniref:hypothetical protein n=1 Tax=Klebsiella TaxID=570 RepID=UPI00063C2492|nr:MULTISPECIES: hypothetical protein [Klebsiella]KLE40914.1 hypothetical protein YA13_21810 [Klebsiella aerogenes]MDH2675932.1 hypothetical protein [Klebsiella quasipneumoniae]MDH2686704.1 hypothetical protein [Klebsiella quasipneumoniae]WFA46204.1 hypothetical protein LVQ73_03210 [Klebsiella pneumoniae]